MSIDAARLLAREFPEKVQTYTERDSILYALGCGLGADPLDRAQLRYVYGPDVWALPTQATILAYPGLWVREPDTGLDWKRVMLGEEGVTWHAPLPPAGTVRAQTRITGIVDKGPGRGALIYSERTGHDAATGAPLFTVSHTTFARGDGGFGGPAGPVRPAQPLPERAPDAVCTLPTFGSQALLFRLHGDPNPHNADPDAAHASGLPGPILAGRCLFGMACHAVLRTYGDYDPAALRSLSVRFSAPVFPGEDLAFDLWRDGTVVSLRARVPARDTVVLNHGRVELAVGT